MEALDLILPAEESTKVFQHRILPSIIDLLVNCRMDMSEVASGVAEGRGSGFSDAAQAGLSGGSLKQVFKQSRNLGENEAYLPWPCHCSREQHSEYRGGGLVGVTGIPHSALPA